MDAVASALRAGGCVFADDEARVILESACDEDDAARLVARRVSGEPLEHVVGWAAFCGQRFAVGPGAFVPRRRTELLARQAAERAPAAGVVVELCCGVGAISAVVASRRPHVALVAVDSDPAAVQYARRNLADSSAMVVVGDLYSPLPHKLRGRVDVIVANAPYVPTAEVALLPAEARLHEPPSALDGGPDGTDLQRRIALDAPEWLAPQGVLLLETSWEQRHLTAGHFQAAGLAASFINDDATNATVVVGTRP